MNASLNHQNTNNGIPYCKNVYNVSGNEVVNTFRCNQRKFSTSDMWQILKNKREFNRK